MKDVCEGSVSSSLPPPSSLLKASAFLWWNSTYLLAVVSSLTFIVGQFLFPRTLGLYVVLPYLLYTLTFRPELHLGAPWPNFSRNLPAIRCLRRYLQLEFAAPSKKLVAFDRKANAHAIFAVFPHGSAGDFRILMDGVLSRILPNMATNVRSLAASVLFRLPFLRSIALWTGCVDARRSVAEGLLDANMSVLVLPGGMDEQIRAEFGKEIVYLKRRKGFVKLAMRKGVPVVPVYVFGNSDSYRTSGAFFGLRHWILKNMGFCIAFYSGLWGSLCPLPVKTTICMGDPLLFECKVKGSPTDDELDAAHAEFIDALVQLFDDQKDKHGYGDRQLIII